MREDAQVKFGGLFGVVIEPEERRKFIHGWHGSSREVTSAKPTSTAKIRERRGTTNLPILKI